MPATITCPNCHTQFEPDGMIREEIQKEVNQKAEDWKRKKEKELEESLRKNIGSDFESKLRILEQSNKDNEDKLKTARQKEIEYLQKEQTLKTKEAELELTVQRKLTAEREKLTADIRKLEEQKVADKENEYQLKLKELEKQLEDQKKLADEMKRKAEQGSMQLQGEVQELALEEMLKHSFPFDVISEVGKGVRGADCIQTIRNNFGQECGKIIYESKRTENFATDWIEKLKNDMHNQAADVAVIVTKTFPKDMQQFGEKQGVYICSFFEVKSLVTVLRTAILKISEAKKIQENKADRMSAIYDYVTGIEYTRGLQMIRENFRNLQIQLDKEKEDFDKNWQKKRKMIQAIIDNSAHISGSIAGISGKDKVDLNLLEDSKQSDSE